MAYGQFDMDIWAFRHTGIDIRTCCRDAGYDHIHCYENSDWECSKYKNMANLLVFLDVYSL